jgi:hypothetical protein
MKKNNINPLIFIIIGLAIMVTAFFADKLGLDPSPGWGKMRIALLIFGLILVFCAMLLWRYMGEMLIVAYRIQSYVENHPIVASVRKNQGLIHLSGLFKKYWFTLPILILVTLVYIWFISSGTWFSWVSPTHYYADLARGFLNGHLYLPIKVNPSLLTSPDPWKPLPSGKSQGPTDFTYFQGKYYLYWGPVPAIILLLIHPIISWRLGDLQLLFGFLTGVFILQSLLAVIIWDRFFSNLPKYLLWLSILLVGLACPATFMLDNHNSARIYEAAITGGQFFLISGFLVALAALDHPNSRWRLELAGVLWALAFGTRLILALPVGIMALTVAWWMISKYGLSFKKAYRLIPLGIPLALGFVCLGWYNWARFGSITETGLYYLLPAYTYYQKYFTRLINPIFIPQNFYNYFLYPFSIRPQFPYFYAEIGYLKPIISSYPLPLFYFSQKISGLIYTVPFTVYALIPSVMYLNNFKRRKETLRSLCDDEHRIMSWVTLTLSGACLAVFGFLLSYFCLAMRYFEDAMPSLIMLSIIGFWLGFQALLQKPFMKRLYAFSGIVLAGASILMSTLVALSMNDARFEIIHFLSSTR